jgi:hypothetical protein
MSYLQMALWLLVNNQQTLRHSDTKSGARTPSFLSNYDRDHDCDGHYDHDRDRDDDDDLRFVPQNAFLQSHYLPAVVPLYSH